MRICSGKALRNVHPKKCKKLLPIYGHSAVRSQKIHGVALEDLLPRRRQITQLDKLRAVELFIIRQESCVIGAAAICFCTLYSSIGINSLHPADEKLRQGAVLERKVCKECIQRMTVYAVPDGGIDDPDAVPFYLCNCNVYNVKTVFSRGGRYCSAHGIRFKAVIQRNPHKNKVSVAKGGRNFPATNDCKEQQNKSQIAFHIAKMAFFSEKMTNFRDDKQSAMKRIIECVPNYSEGRDRTVIDAIVAAIGSVDGVKILDVDPGEATNRTVVTFVGEPEPVCEAAFLGAAKAQELIDMRKHHGAHPRSGATDVLPLIPVSGITLEECAELARNLARRLYGELGIPCYCYEAAAFKPERKNLAVCREGEYEALREKMADDYRKPDFCGSWDAVCEKSGATNVGARGFLVAVNFNLNTTSTRRAMAVAFDVREKGRKNPSGEGWIPGTLKGTKAIGWYIDEYGIAQVSMNITDIDVTPLHVAFEEVSAKAAARGLRVTGTEIVGLVPKKVLIDAGRFYLEKQQRSLGISEQEIVKIAVKSMSLDDLKPFNPSEKVIEYLLADEKKGLARMTLEEFTRETASESPAPGGGSVSAAMGAFGAALATMVANLSSHKRGWDARWKEFSDVAEEGQALLDRLLQLIDEDTAAFNRIMDCYGMPKDTDAQKARRAAAIEEATLYAAKVPLETMETALKALPLALAMARTGNPASASDAGVAALAAVAGIRGARLNVRINAAALKDKASAQPFLQRADEIEAEAAELEKQVLEEVNNHIGL